MTKTDFKLILGLLILGLLILLLSRYISANQPYTGQATVKVQNQAVAQLDLNKDTGPEPILIQGKIGLAKIEIQNKKVRIAEATCPDQICVRQSWISSPGQAIICVPNELVIYINDKASLDAIIR